MKNLKNFLINKTYIILIILFFNMQLIIAQKENINKSYELLNKFKSFFYKTNKAKTVKIDIDGLSGTIPYKLYLIMQELKNNNSANQESNLIPQGLILYGPPGNGKSTLARKVASFTDSILIEIKGSTSIKKYIGEGAENIDDIFNKAEETAHEENKRVIIFIDEVDAFASNNNNSEMTREHESVVQTLWLNIDKFKNNKKIFIILATNKFKNLHPTLVDRFGDDIIEIVNPDAEMRREIIEFYTKKFNVIINESIITKLIKQTENFSIRAIEDTIKSARRRFNVENNNNINIGFAELLEESVTINQKKPKYDSNVTSLTEDQRSIIKWQKASIIVSIFVTILPILNKIKPVIFQENKA